jgi:Ca-activated chloride channel family protein
MSFGEPVFLWWLLALPLAAALVGYEHRRRRKRLEQLVAGRLLPELTDSVAASRMLIKRILYLGALAAILLALARPQFGFIEQNFEQHGRDIALVIDTSKSMLSTDETPNRLERAKVAAQDILAAMHGDRIGLIAFAGVAQVQAPITIDYETVLDAITDLSTNTVERGGTDITSAIRAAELALGKSQDRTKRAMVLITDGEDLEEDSVAAAKTAASYGIRIFTVGLGTREGSEIPIDAARQEFVRDPSGNIVRSRLDENRLGRIAEQTGGFYIHLDNESVAQLINNGLRKLGERDVGERSTQIPIERYRWPLVMGLILLAASSAVNVRRQKALSRSAAPATVSAALLAMLVLALTANADSGLDQYAQGDFEGALKNFRAQQKRDPESPSVNFNLGNAAYRLQKYDEAFEAYSKAMVSGDPGTQEAAYYNAGNALFKAGDHAQDLEQQLTSYYDARYQYQQALNRNPGDEQAKKNLRLLEERIKDVEQQKQEEQLRQRQQQRQSSGQRRQQRRDRQRRDGMQDRQSNPSAGDSEDDQSSGDQQDQPSDRSDSGDADAQNEPTPGPDKNGELRELTPSDEQKERSGQAQESGSSVMSEDEAHRLLDSLKDESDRIDLMHQKTERPVLRDW